LSSKPAKSKSKKRETETSVNEAPKRPSGKAPEAMVSSRRGVEMVTRLGRGFSYGELSGAGLSPRLASQWGARVDSRRRSVLDDNVGALRKWGGHLASAKKPEGRIKKVEEELVKAEKEVEKGAAEVKEEAVKVEKVVKKEAAKAEKVVKARGKPRKKAKA
jgi:ribosomal protein L13E